VVSRGRNISRSRSIRWFRGRSIRRFRGRSIRWFRGRSIRSYRNSIWVTSLFVLIIKHRLTVLVSLGMSRVRIGIVQGVIAMFRLV